MEEERHGREKRERERELSQGELIPRFARLLKKRETKKKRL